MTRPQTRQRPAMVAPAEVRNTGLTSYFTPRVWQRPDSPPRCRCGWAQCPHRTLWWHDLSQRADVLAGAPSDWHAMLAAGFDPVTGEPLVVES